MAAVHQGGVVTELLDDAGRHEDDGQHNVEGFGHSRLIEIVGNQT